MKVWIVYLAILIVIISFIPYLFSAYIIYDKNGANNTKIELYNHISGDTQKVPLEDYIVGVVCAEMPAEFSLDALKAQSVAARTYAIKKLSGASNDHSNGDLCTDYAHCQAYITEENCRAKWGNNYNTYIKKIKNAVQSTSGEYLVYNSEPAMTVFHSCSNGITEKASDVWGGDIPYLVNVKSEGDLLKKDYITTNEFQYDEFIKILEEYLNTKIENTAVPIGNIAYSTGGNILTIELFGHSIKGTDIRKIYSLKSTSFDLELADNKFVFTVSGNGHGVGMSQYGANSMASNNSSYKEILYHYYPGTEICVMNKLD